MTTKAKKYTLSSPLSGEQIGNIDEMLDDLYKRVSFALSSTTAHMGAFGEGDLLYFDGTGVESITAAATGNALISGGLLTEPSWGKIGLTTHVSGTLAVGNGGTGTATTFTQGSVVFAGASGIYTQDNANLFFDDATNALGVGTTGPSSSFNRTLNIHDTTAGGNAALALSMPTKKFSLAIVNTAFRIYDETNSLYRLAIDTNGKFGFKTTAPQFEGVNFGGLNQSGGPTSPIGVYWQYGTNAASRNWGLVTDYDAFGALSVVTSSAKTDGLVDLTRLYISTTGNVGLGTTNPTKLLTLQDTGADASDNYAAMEIKTTGSSGFGPAIYFNGSSMTGGRHWLLNAAGTQDSAGVGKFSIYDVTGSADRLVINSSGNVGIGTTSPATALDVVGGISSTGRIITTSTSALGGITIDSAEAARFAIDRGSTAFVALFQFATAGSNKWFFGMDAATGDDFIVQNAALGTNLRISGLNVGIGDVTSPTSGDLVLIFGDGTAPSGMASNTAGLYANDVGGTVNMYAINEAGESTRLSWPAPQTYTVTNGTTDRSYNADSYTGDEIADVLATLIADLQARGILA